jgi:hypothetical protein
MDEDRVYVGRLKIVANAGQSFAVRVTVEVSGNGRGSLNKRPRQQVPEPDPAPSNSLPSWLPAAEEPALASGPPPMPRPAPRPAAEGKPFADLGPHAPPTPPAHVTAPPPMRGKAAPPLAPPSGRHKPEAVVLAPRRPARAEPPAPEEEEAGPTAGPLQALVVGALLGLLLRLLLLGPADLWARVIGNPVRTPAPGGLDTWLASPVTDESFFRLFVLATWWVGTLVGVVLVRQRGGRFLDLPFGAVAGTVAGLAGAATLGCVLVLGDGVPRLLLGLLPLKAHGSFVALYVALWAVLAVVCWTVMGALLGLVLGICGRPGLRLLALLASPIAWVLRLFGLGRFGSFFALEGS